MIKENRDDIFINQSLELTLRAHMDLTGATLQAKIIEPDETASTHIVTITDITNGYTKLIFVVDELDKLGLWQIKLYDTVSKIAGKIFKLYVNALWEK